MKVARDTINLAAIAVFKTGLAIETTGSQN